MFPQDGKLAVSILDFTGEDVSDKVLRACYQKLETSLIESNRFTVIAKNQREQILEEMKFQSSGICDEACAVEIGQLVGSDALPIDQQLTLEVARMIREYFLQQNAFHPVDTYSTLKLQYAMTKAILTFQEESKKAIAAGALLEDVVNVPARTTLMRARLEEGYLERMEELVGDMCSEIQATAEAV